MVGNNVPKYKLMVPTQSARLYTHLEVGRNKPVRVTARTGVAYMDVGKGREQERKLFRQTPHELAGNATSRDALGWPYSGLHPNIPKYKLMVPTQSARLYTHLEVGRNKPVRATVRTGVAYMDVGKGREQERKLFRQTPHELAGNATSRDALGWPYSGLHPSPPFQRPYRNDALR